MRTIIALLLLAGLAIAPAEAKRKEKRAARQEQTTPAEEQPKPVSTEELETALRRVEHDLDSLKREFGYAIWSRYLEEQMRREYSVDFKKLPAVDMDDLCNRDPELALLRENYTKLNDSCNRIRKTRPEYERLSREYRLAVNANDKQALAKNKTDFEEFYKKLEQEDPGYNKLEKSRKTALRRQNYAILRLLIADYRERNAVMPVDGVIGTEPYKKKAELLQSFPELGRLDQTISQLNRIQYELSRELMNRKYLPEPLRKEEEIIISDRRPPIVRGVAPALGNPIRPII